MKKRFFINPKIWVSLMTVILVTGCQPSRFIAAPVQAESISDCHQVEFIEFKQISEVATTWRYRVGGTGCASQIHSWMLELPSCASVVEASPPDWQAAGPDPGYQMNGVKWQPGTDFQNGEFSVTLLGDLGEGTTRAGVEEQTLIIDSVKGPVCRDLARAPAALTSIATAKVKVQSANCRAMPVGKAQKIALLYRDQEAEIVGRNDDPNNPWWYVKIPGQEANCWLWDKTVTTTGALENIPVMH